MDFNENSELPIGWAKAKLPDAIELIMGQSPSSSDCNSDGKGLPFYQGKTEFGKVYPTVRKYCTSPKKLAVKNDVLLSVRAPVGPTNLATERCAIGRGLAVLRGNENVDFKYLFSYMRHIEPWLSEQGTGTTFKAVSGVFLKELDFYVAPLPEQKRIVEKLDSLLAQVETIQQRLNNLPDIIKRFRQSVLAAAVSGKLTEHWRNKTSIELPKQSCLKELGRIVGGKTPSKSRIAFWESGTIPWVSPKDMKVYEIAESMDLITELAITEGGMKLVPKGSILMVTRSGILSHSFPVAVTTKDLTINQDIKAFIPDSRLITSHFAGVLMKGLSHRVLDECSKVGTTVSSVETSKLVNLKFDLPNLVEQVEIVRLVKQYFALADTLEKHLADAKTRVDNLTQSILAKAFRGELVSQDPNDEPADKLLERIKTARLETEKLEKAAKKAAKVKQ